MSAKHSNPNPDDAPAAPAGQAPLDLDADTGDLVDAIFAMLPELIAQIVSDPQRMAQAKMAMRREFGGRKDVYIRRPAREEADQRAQEILRLFNGRNASEVARKLNIGRATVYRVLKQAGK